MLNCSSITQESEPKDNQQERGHQTGCGINVFSMTSQVIFSIILNKLLTGEDGTNALDGCTINLIEQKD